MTMTYAIARAAGTDVANARMRKAGRSTWNKADYHAAARTFARLTRDMDAQWPAKTRTP
jgi:hypothetical protein